MKISRLYMILVVICILIFIVVEVFRERNVSWKPTFSSHETMPYGTYVLYQLLPDLFPEKTIKKNFKNYRQMLENGELDTESLIIIGSEFRTDPYSVNAILDYVDEGHQVLISALQLDQYLLDTLGISTGFSHNGLGRGNPVIFNFKNKVLRSDSGFQYKFPMYSFFNSNDTAGYKVLGHYLDGKINFIKFNIGEGELFLNTVPLAFTNYNLLKKHTSEYAEKLFSMMAVNDIIWDEHIRRVKMENTSILRYILSEDSLRTAFSIILLLGMLYLIFAGKRRQQMIPLIVPLENSTHRFIKTLGRLYLYQKNHKDIAQKKIRFFTEFIQNRYAIQTKDFNAEFLRRFAQKSGSSEESVAKLVNLIHSIESKNEISEKELVELDRLIDKYMK